MSSLSNNVRKTKKKNVQLGTKNCIEVTYKT